MALLATIPPPPLQGVELGPLDLRLYGALIAVGAYLGLRLMVRRYTDLGGDGDLAERTALVAIGAAIVGARIGYLLPRLDYFLANPIEMPMIWRGGLAFFGGVALAVPTAWWYANRRGAHMPALIDAVAPALPLGHAIGRWGNYFNQELYGRPTDLPWALEVEPGRRPSPSEFPEFAEAATFHPTFLYESLWNLGLVALLLLLDKRGVLRRGSLGFVYLVGYGVGRFWLELLRIDVPERYLGLSRNGWNSVLVVVVGLVGLWWWQRRGRAATHETSPATPDADTSAPDEPSAGGRTETEGGAVAEADDGDDDGTPGRRGP